MKKQLFAVALWIAIGVSGAVRAQTTGGLSTLPGPAALLDATGKFAARALNDTLMLITISPDVVAPAFIRPVYGADERAASGLATWASGGSVLFTSPDCSTGAHVHTLDNAGLRSTSQVETPAGTMLYIGAIGLPVTAQIRSILYSSGCAAVTVQQQGLIPVVVAVNLTTLFPPPLALR